METEEITLGGNVKGSVTDTKETTTKESLESETEENKTTDSVESETKE